MAMGLSPSEKPNQHLSRKIRKVRCCGNPQPTGVLQQEWLGATGILGKGEYSLDAIQNQCHSHEGIRPNE